MSFIKEQQEEARRTLGEAIFNEEDNSLDKTLTLIVSQVVQNTVEEIVKEIDSLKPELGFLPHPDVASSKRVDFVFFKDQVITQVQSLLKDISKGL